MIDGGSIYGDIYSHSQPLLVHVLRLLPVLKVKYILEDVIFSAWCFIFFMFFSADEFVITL